MQQKKWRNTQKQKTDFLFRLPVLCAHCYIGPGKFGDGGINLNYFLDKFSKGCGEFISCFRHIIKHNTLSLPITQNAFRSDIGYNLHVFNVRYRKTTASQIVKFSVIFRGDFEAGRYFNYSIVVMQ